jgi:hypothetical protein
LTVVTSASPCGSSDARCAELTREA